jgi:hypothetical protein
MPNVFFAPLFLLDVAAALYLWGVIWTVQIVHYPLFARVGAENWEEYHNAHLRLLALTRPSWLSPPLLWAGFACAVLTWAVTFFVSVPLHGTLSRSFDEAAIARLVATNWLRTVFWTAHVFVLLTQVWRLLPKP